jgi:hypothetical protein
MSKIKFTGLQQLALFFNQLGRIKNFARGCRSALTGALRSPRSSLPLVVVD